MKITQLLSLKQKLLNLCDYSDAYIFVEGNVTATGGNQNIKVAFKNLLADV